MDLVNGNNVRKKYSKKNLIYIDILGFSEKVADIEWKNLEGIVDIDIKKRDLEENFLEGFLNFANEFFSQCGCAVILLSDTIIICFDEMCYDDIKNIFNALSTYIIRASELKIFFRGVIHRGNLYLDKNSNIIFGSALIDAHKMEKQDAIYPRILITQEFSSLLIDKYPKLYLEILKKDFDGLEFFNFLNLYRLNQSLDLRNNIITSFKKIVKERRNFFKNKKLKEFSKMFYLQNYYLEFAKDINDKELIKIFNEEISIIKEITS